MGFPKGVKQDFNELEKSRLERPNFSTRAILKRGPSQTKHQLPICQLLAWRLGGPVAKTLCARRDARPDTEGRTLVFVDESGITQKRIESGHGIQKERLRFSSTISTGGLSLRNRWDHVAELLFPDV